MREPATGLVAEGHVTDGDGSFGDAGTTLEPTRSGEPAVDEILAEIEGLDDVPLEQHLATFERAHDVLRSALDAEPGDPA